MHKLSIGVIAALALGAAILPSAGSAQTLEAIQQSGTLLIGHRSSSVPFSYVADGESVPKGYSIDLCLEIAEAVKVRLAQTTISIDWVPVDAKTRMEAIESGRVHIECGSTTNTLSRQQSVGFSFITYITGTRLLVRKSEGINHLKDLQGKLLAVVGNTTTERAIKGRAERAGLNLDIVHVDDHAHGLAGLQEGVVDAYASDDVLLYGLISEAEDPEGFEVVGGYLSYEPYALMIPRGDPDFALLVNTTLARLFRSGAMEHLHAKWFESLNAPMPDLLRAAFVVNGLPD